jgi:hypothetical protein
MPRYFSNGNRPIITSIILNNNNNNTIIIQLLCYAVKYFFHIPPVLVFCGPLLARTKLSNINTHQDLFLVSSRMYTLSKKILFKICKF